MSCRVVQGCLAMVPAIVLCGCGGDLKTYSVQGTVTGHDGKPLEGAQLVWQCADPPLSATAVTDASGRYRLGTLAAADGAPAGEYEIAITEPQSDDPDAPPPNRIHPHYARFETSGLRFTVEPRSNRFDIQLEPFDAPALRPGR
ncbi:MAG: carboxypeptidase-like regulatory domain-containing protein [Patescibacteria group bacterium]|nr:carboxypeptidase-like regulatory domain-containing protein [Patescibacteria group bacterium]